jgi:hypothetical protein
MAGLAAPTGHLCTSVQNNSVHMYEKSHIVVVLEGMIVYKEINHILGDRHAMSMAMSVRGCLTTSTTTPCSYC